MKRFLLLLFMCVPTLAQAKPNVIIIFTDDQGSIDANCYGAKDLVTPGMDGLAKQGVRLTQFYAAAPVCSPSRAGLLTGRYPVRAGVPGNVSSQKGKRGMPAEQVTIAETFKAAGYATAHIGKWHLGYTDSTMPNGQGFDYSFGHMGGCIDNYSHFFYWQGPNRHDLWRQGKEIYRDGQYFPDLMVEEAATFIDAQKDKPFFMYFASNAPHYPYQGEAHWLKHYEKLPYPRNLYAAFLSSLDKRIQDLVNHLEQRGIRKNTIIVFQSDHGHSTEQRAHGGGGNSGPYRGAKFSFYEGGLRVPAIISWPGKLPEGAVRDQLGHGCDWLPTLADLCEIKLVQTDIDGKSLVPVLRSNAATPHQVVHWMTGKNWAVREGDWKLIKQGKTTSLYNLSTDIGETKNLAKAHTQKVSRLKQLHDEWYQTANR